jgi:uncharacterized protein YndB with AHSA1/START domain
MSKENKNKNESVAASTADREIVISRLLDAPRELVFQAFTDPQHVVHWWGPDGFTNTISEMSVHAGGVWCFIMHGPDGTDYPNQIVYSEVSAPARLVYTHGDGISEAGQFHVTVTFEAQGRKTLLTMRSLFATAAECEHVKGFGAIEGGQQTLQHLEDYLPTMAR